MIRYASYSAVGGRPYNEDTVRVAESGGDRLCAVLADGLGGHGGGDRASQAAAEVVCAGWDGAATPDSLRRLAEEANAAVLAMQTPECRMKTTLVVLSLAPGRFDWAYAGDSRLYHFADGTLRWQTRDHSASQIAVMLGQIEPRDIRFHEDRSRIFRAIGQADGPGADAGGEELAPGAHAFLLCSDGFWEYVYEEEMERTLREAASPEDWLARMRAIVDGRTPEDNDNNSAIAVWTTV